MSNTQGYEFVNPYNFIPLGEKRAAVSSEEEKNLTGVIEYSVLTKTPLFIPNTSSDNAFNTYKKEEEEEEEEKEKEKKRHKSYDFFTYTDLTGKTEPAQDAKPVIPGSEIRGMFRSNYEILTNSCLSAVDVDATMSRRINLIYKAGLLKRIEPEDSDKEAESNQKNYCFELYEADSYRVKIELNETKDEDKEDGEKKPAEVCVIDPSIIEKNQKDDLDEFYKKAHEGAKVFFAYNNDKKVKVISSFETEKCKKAGYLLKGYPGETKKYCHVFAQKVDQKGKATSPSQISCNILEELDAVLNAYEKEGDHPYTEYRNQLKSFKAGESKEEFFPVFYSKFSFIVSNDTSNSERIVLSPAAITRETYDRKIKDMLYGFQPCNAKSSLCPACSLFGTVVQKPQAGVSSFGVTSRIRFSDLTCDEESTENCYMDKVTLAPLSSPKLNNMEFYLRRPAPDAIFWTYDYYIDKKGKLHPNECGINGRKFYWHNMSPDLTGCTPSNQNITVRPVKAKIQFYGKLYFQKLSATELNQLIYLLNAGEDDSIEIQDRTHGYKLGGAKPLGLGSIAVSVSQVMIRDVVKDSDKRCVERTEHPYEGYKPPKFDETIVADFEKMTNFDFVNGENVSYPLTGKESDEGYTWYVQNHVTTSNGYLTGGMPNKREMMGYAEYMQAMEPKTQKVEFRKFQRDQVYEAKVVGCNKKKVFIKVNGVSGEIYYKNISGAREGELNKRFRKDEKIRVNYIGSSEHEGKVSYNFKPVQ